MKPKEHLRQYWFLYVAIASVLLFLIIGYKLKVNLSLMGLILSFIGSVRLVFDTLFDFGRERTVFTPVYGKGYKIKRFIRLQKKQEGGYKEVKISKEEIKLIISLSLLSLGFLLQIFDFIPKDFWANY